MNVLMQDWFKRSHAYNDKKMSSVDLLFRESTTRFFSVADPGGNGAMPPDPVKISHKKWPPKVAA